MNKIRKLYLNEPEEFIIYKTKPSLNLTILLIFLINILSLFILYSFRYIFIKAVNEFELIFNISYSAIFKSIYFYLILILLIVNIVFTAKFLFFYYFTDYFITNKRVISLKGFIKLNTFDIPLSKIETIYVSQDIISRILNLGGSVIIIGSGGSQKRINNISNPFLFKRKLDEILYKR